MQIRLEDIIASYQEFQEFCNIHGLTATRTYQLAKLHRKIEAAYKDYQVAITKLGEKYGEPAPQPGSFTVKPENIEIVTAQMKELQEQTIEVSFEPITEQELDMGVDSIKLSPAMLSKLHWLIALD